jgi:catechol 2,3-dioxygenase-like lactoylglutathione lyase family enzyme
VLDRSADLAAEPTRAVEDIRETVRVDVERDLVGIVGSSGRSGRKEDEQGVPEPQRPVCAVDELATGELAVEVPEPVRIACAEREVVDAEYAQKGESRLRLMTRIWPQPLIVVRDVEASSRFYQQVLGAESGHGGDEYEQIVGDGEILLQIHRVDVEDHHGPLADPDQSFGNGVLLWFEVSDFEAAAERVRATGAPVVHDVHTNPRALQKEIWVRDADGYLVVLAGPSEYRSRS